MIDEDVLNNYRLQARRMIELKRKIVETRAQLEELTRERHEAGQLFKQAAVQMSNELHADIDAAELGRSLPLSRHLG